MQLGRKDYKDINELDKKIPADEPVFLLRGQDPLAWKVAEYYVRLRRSEHFKGEPGLDEMSEQLLVHADKMRQWPDQKMADLPTAAPEEKKTSRKAAKKE